MENITPGIIHYVAPDLLIASRGNTLYKSCDQGNTWSEWCKLLTGSIKHLLSTNRWSSRLTRSEVFQVVSVSEKYFACFGFGNIYLIKSGTGEVKTIGKITGTRVLTACTIDGKIYYGEYSTNRERQPVSLYCYDITDEIWSEIFTFSDIRHIHGVFWDDYQSKLWITTGDTDEESAIIRFNDEKRPEKIVSGSQQTRAVDLLFAKTAVFFATDAPDEQNYICRLDRDSKSIERQQAVGGPVFWGRQEGKWLFFSTAVEPSEVNRTDAVELWGSKKGGEEWVKVLELQKDRGSNLFQHGQVKFPTGPGDGEYLWFTPYATEYDHRILRYRLQDLL